MNLKSFSLIIALFALAGCAANAESSAADAGTFAASKSEDTTAATAVSTSQPEATAPAPEAPMLDLPDLGVAPEFRNDLWLNAEAPVTLASLEGKVVLLEFWTFG